MEERIAYARKWQEREQNCFSAIQFKVNILDQKQVEAIHLASLNILDITVTRMPHAELQDALEAKGVKVERKKGLVYWPPELVEELLRGKIPVVFNGQA